MPFFRRIILVSDAVLALLEMDCAALVSRRNELTWSPTKPCGMPA
jgi:hypothetical protein